MGRDGMTNYIHTLGADHVTYYLLKKPNLYRYRNQTWERLNKHVRQKYPLWEKYPIWKKSPIHLLNVMYNNNILNANNVVYNVMVI